MIPAPLHIIEKDIIMNSDFSRIPVAVIGLGLMGGSFAKRLKELGHPVIGINRTESVAREALSMGIVDTIDPGDLKKAEIVIFCTPEKGTLAFIKEHLSLLQKGAVLTDIAGVKNGFAKELRAILPRMWILFPAIPCAAGKEQDFPRPMAGFLRDPIISSFRSPGTGRSIWSW